MRRGIMFEESNVENVFQRLNVLMDVPSYDWYIDDVDLNYINFRSGKYNGEEFQNMLDEISVLSFARIRRYPMGMPVDDIDEYKDYIMSSCDMLILFYDGGFFEIYEKKEDMISKTMDFCLNSGFENIKYIHDSDGTRSYMHF